MFIAFVFNLFNNQRQIIMKKLLPTTTLITLEIAAPAFAQTFIDGFSGGYDDSAWTEVNTLGANVVLKEELFGGDGSADFINYHTGGSYSAGIGELAYLNYVGTGPVSPTNQQDFSVSIGTSNYSNALTFPATAGFDYAQIGLPIGDSIDLDSAVRLNNGSHDGVSDSRVFDPFSGAFAEAGDTNIQVLGKDNIADFQIGLLVNFDSSTQTFTFSRSSVIGQHHRL